MRDARIRFDSRTSVEILALFQRLNREEGITVILVTHEPDAAAHASRILRFRDGRIVEDERVAGPRDAVRSLEAAGPVNSRGVSGTRQAP